MGFEIDTYRLEAFFEVVKTKNFSKAAKNLGITQSALSQRVARLEDQLEQTLFIRDPKNLRLTISGESLLKYCHAHKNLEEEYLNNLISKDSAELNGVVRVAGYSSVMRSIIIPSLSELAAKNARLRFEFRFGELDQIPELLLRGACDFLIHTGSLDKDGLEKVVLGKEENVEITCKKDSKPNTYLDHDENDNTTIEFLKHQGKKENISRDFMGNIYGIIDGVKLGYGRAVVSRHLVKDDKKIKILDNKKSFFQDVYLYYYKRSYMPKLHQKTLDELRSNFSKFS